MQSLTRRGAATGTSFTAGRPQGRPAVADALAPLLAILFADEIPVRFRFWDGSAAGPEDSSSVVFVRSRDALRRIAWAPGELGIGRAYVTGDIDFDGDIFDTLRRLQAAAPRFGQIRPKAVLEAISACASVGAIGLPLAPPPEEIVPRGKHHSTSRDSKAVRHHYDVGNEFYEIVLGPSMVYSCARFAEPATSLEEAQTAKNDLVCRKLGLDERPGARLLDVGCGWGAMAIHAASSYGAEVVGVTLSPEQAAYARKRVKDQGLEGKVDIRVQDYRNLASERFDAISSIGMFEHVGKAKTAEYFNSLWRLLNEKGRLLNHAISTRGGSVLNSRSFMGRYVFPDAELIDVGDVVMAMEGAGFEVRDVESLREHYSKTLHRWVENLEQGWDRAVKHVGVNRARIWRIYMAGSAVGFDDGGIAVHQVLGVKPGHDGVSGMPPTRAAWA